MIKFIDQIEKDLAMGNHEVSVYIEVSKVFDSCDHSIIINKIRRMGLDTNGIKIMTSCL